MLADDHSVLGLTLDDSARVAALAWADSYASDEGPWPTTAPLAAAVFSSLVTSAPFVLDAYPVFGLPVTFSGAGVWSSGARFAVSLRRLSLDLSGSLTTVAFVRSAVSQLAEPTYGADDGVTCTQFPLASLAALGDALRARRPRPDFSPTVEFLALALSEVRFFIPHVTSVARLSAVLVSLFSGDSHRNQFLYDNAGFAVAMFPTLRAAVLEGAPAGSSPHAGANLFSLLATIRSDRPTFATAAHVMLAAEALLAPLARSFPELRGAALVAALKNTLLDAAAGPSSAALSGGVVLTHVAADMPAWRQLTVDVGADPTNAVGILLSSNFAHLRKILAEKAKGGTNAVHVAAREARPRVTAAFTVMLRRAGGLEKPLSSSQCLSARECHALLLGDAAAFADFHALAGPLRTVGLLEPHVLSGDEHVCSPAGAFLVGRVEECMRELFAALHYDNWTAFCADVRGLVVRSFSYPGLHAEILAFVRDAFADFSAGVRVTLASDNVCGLVSASFQGAASSSRLDDLRKTISIVEALSMSGAVRALVASESLPSRALSPHPSHSAVPPPAPSVRKSGAAASPHAGSSAAPSGVPPPQYDGPVYLPLNDHSLFYKDVKYDVQLTAAALDRPASDVCFPVLLTGRASACPYGHMPGHAGPSDTAHTFPSGFVAVRAARKRPTPGPAAGAGSSKTRGKAGAKPASVADNSSTTPGQGNGSAPRNA
ncbi:hypothetical protein KFE25_010259 [Diacronema lutheri]|uniref:Uncharacterized protein n=1 Tax=Diacronema lutheri TaxID=2081491 RepID=A0A8J5XAE9_DIALT|nr:hypothetical protein KFE25_010259 [Diacronema lutheri]